MCRKNLKQFILTEDEKLQLHFKYQLINWNEKSYRAQIRAGIKSPNTNSNFFKPKWVKLGTLLKITETKLKNKSLVTARGHKENQK